MVAFIHLPMAIGGGTAIYIRLFTSIDIELIPQYLFIQSPFGVKKSKYVIDRHFVRELTASAQQS